MQKLTMPPVEYKVELPQSCGGRLSPTQIDMYLRCPLQYYHRYIEGAKEPPGVALIEGSSHHAGLEMNNNHKVVAHEDLPIHRIVERFEDEFSTRKKDITDWQGETTESIINRGRKIVKTYLNDFAPHLQPELVEHEFKLKVGAVPVIGYMDVAGDFSIGDDGPTRKVAIDYKVVARAKSAAEVEGSVQLGFYGWGLRDLLSQKEVGAGFCCLKKTKTPSVEWQPTKITTGRLRWLRHIVTHVAFGIQSGSFPPCDPCSWCCCPRFCGFYAQCRGKYNV